MFLTLGQLPWAASADQGCPLLIAAARAGDEAAVSQALAESADPDCFDGARNTALIYAARDGRLAIAERLIAAGATIDWIDGEGVTPLILAAFKGHEALVRRLLAEGARTEMRDQ